MSESNAIEHHTVSCAGVELHYVEAKPADWSESHDKPTLVFFHGFPEYWESWREQLAYFGQRFRVIAPDLPGYNLSEKPADASFYQVPNLIRVMAAFLEAVSPSTPVTLIAHDWGGVIAWPLAAFHPQLIRRLVIINAAHPSTFTRELARNPQQRQKSRYIKVLTSPDGPERVSADNFQFLREMVFGTMAGDPLPEERKAAYLDAWSQPGALDAMLNYYRQMPQVISSDESDKQSDDTAAVRLPNIRVEVPTLVLWGDNDAAFAPEVLDGLDTYVKDLRVVRYPSQTHWLHHEHPLNIAKEIEGFIAHK